MRIRRVRLIGRCTLAVAAVLVAVIGITNGREIGVRTHRGAFIALGSGCLQVGVNTDRFQWSTPDLLLGPAYAMRAWHDDWALAWRPFRVRIGVGQRYLVAPLWLPTGALLVVGGYAMGVLAGVRASRSQACLACGYLLEGSPARDGAVTCPECGAVRRTYR